MYIQDVDAYSHCQPKINRLTQVVVSILKIHLQRTEQIKVGLCQNLKLNNNIYSHHVPDGYTKEEKHRGSPKTRGMNQILFFLKFPFLISLLNWGPRGNASYNAATSFDPSPLPLFPPQIVGTFLINLTAQKYWLSRSIVFLNV